MEHLGNFPRPLSWLAFILAIASGCAEPAAPETEAPRATSSASAALTIQGPVLVGDLSIGWPDKPGSDPAGFIEVGNAQGPEPRALFAAREASSGRELWRSDGTESGTLLFKDLRPGPDSSSPTDFVAMGGFVYFTADDGVRGRELWRTDGDTLIELVKDINPGPGASSPTSLEVVNGVLYFSATDGQKGLELWRSDGTSAGTVLAVDIVQGSGSSSPQDLTAAGGQLFFSATTPSTGRELWRSDGTSTGTVLVKQVAPFSNDGYVSGLVGVGSRVFFVGLDGSVGPSLWTSDGTAAGTRLIHAPTSVPASEGLPVRSLTAVGDKLFFVATGVNGTGTPVGFELWASDGVTTWLVRDILPGSASSKPEALVAVGGTLYFRGNDGGTGAELWRSDGTQAGTRRVIDLVPGASGSGPEQLTDIHGVLYFTANAGSRGRELWRSDGTDVGTQWAQDINPVGDSNPEGMAAIGTHVFFSADNGSTGREPWWSDSTPFSPFYTSLVKDIHVGMVGSDPQGLTVFGGALYFTANTEGFGREPWLTDANGPRLLKDIQKNSLGSNPGRFVPRFEALFFDADDGVHGRELWTSDGTEAGTRLLLDIQPGDASSSSAPRDLRLLTTLGSRLFFTANDGQTGFEPWVSDGSPVATRLLKDIWAGNTGDGMSRGFIEFQTRAYFGASDGSGTTLWQSTGSAAGTVSLKNVVPYFDTAFAAGPNWFYFPGASGGSTTVGLWKSNGTALGTNAISAASGPSPTFPDDFVMMDNVLYFSAVQTSPYRSLWRSDGTSAGTRTVVNIPTGTAGLDPRNLTVANRVLFFQAYEPETGTELWRSDGTAVGTRPVRDLNPGPVGSMAGEPILALEPEGLVVFSASDGVHGVEPWISDGTEAGTQMLADLAPGGLSSNPRLFTRQGKDIYFVANDGTTGFELWRVTLDIPPDTTPPTVTCPASRTAEATSSAGAQVSYPAATVTDDTPGRPVVTYSQASGATFPMGTTTVTVTATDAVGNRGSCSFDVTVRDTTAPSLTCPANVTAEATDSTGALVSYPAATASDVASRPVTLSYSQSSGTVFPLGTTAVTVTAADTAGNSRSCSFNVTVRDGTKPSLTCPADVTAEATSASGAAVSYPAATADDAVSPPVTLSYSQDSGTVFPLGVTGVTATATDAAGNSNTCTFSVTVRDTAAPVLGCPAEVLAEAMDATGTRVSYPAVTVSDAVTASPELTYSQEPGTLFPPGTTRVNVTARDAAGNTAACAFDVTVRDTTAPDVTCPADVVTEAASASGAAVSFQPATASDAVTASLVLGYSHASGETFPLGTTRVTVTATDAAGNAGTCAFSVLVRDTTVPTLSCPSDVTAEATSASGASVSYAPATASDTVTASPVLDYSRASGARFPLGTTHVNVTATDEAGNSAACTFDVTVRDTTAPSLSCPLNVTSEATGASGALVGYADASTSDAVTASPVLAYSLSSGTMFPPGVTTVKVTATDEAGNSASCAFDIIVRDTTAPSLSCPADATAEATGTSGATVRYAPATASDAVTSPVTLTYSQDSGTVFPLGTTAVTVSTKDAAGNAASCSFDVTVRDATAPALTCPTDTSVEATSASGATVEYAPATASDAVTASPVVGYSHASGMAFPPGATDVTVTARDAAGNETACHFTVLVRDTTPPSVGCTSDLTVEAEGADGASVAFELASPMDAVTRSPQVSSSHAPGSRFPLGTTAVTVTARDEADNTASCTFSITVRDSTPPDVTCPSDVTVATQDAGGTPVTFTATAHDTVTASPELTYSHASGGVFAIGTTPVTVTARDEAGLTAACTFQVTVRRPASVPAPEEAVGCACDAGASGGGSLWLLLLGSAVWLQRRSRVR